MNRRTTLHAVAVLFVAGLVAAGVTAGAAGPYKRVAPEPVIGGISAEEYSARQRDLHDWLMKEVPDGLLTNPVRVNLTDEERSDLNKRKGAAGGPAVVGRTKPVAQELGFSGPGAARFLRRTDDGGFVWARAIRSDGAEAIRLHFQDVSLPGDADLFVAGREGQVFQYTGKGPHGDGDFWSHTIFGSEAIVVMRHYGPNGFADLRGTSFRVTELGHIGSGFTGALGTEAFCQFNEPCIENAECENFAGGSPGDQAQRAIALMQWISGAFINTCTGGLIADTDPSAQPRLFLTANHCMSRNKDARNLESHFQYTVACGTTSCPGQTTQPGSIQVLGASILDSSANGDHTLLELDGADPLPGDAFFMGWNNAPVANSNGVALQRVSHPAWAPQAYSTQTVDTSAGTCNTIPRGEFIYSRDTFGATEGGSSGSPVWNSSGEIVGQLFGACGFNVNDPCDAVSNATVDGALAFYFPDVEQFLDPAGCTVTENPEVTCDDGTDNDCDGATDCDDADCSGDPACDTGGCVNPGGAPPGASCTADAECCSDKCKGPPGGKTCR